MTTHTDGHLSTGQYRQTWTPEGDVVGVVVLVHGLHEHAGRYAHVAQRLARSGYATWAPDHPGHGRSPGSRGNIGSLAGTVAGVDETAQLAAAAHPGIPLFVYGHSMGGLVAAQYLTGAPSVPVRGGVLSAAALDLSSANRVVQLVAPVLGRLLPDLGTLQLDAEAVSRDPAVVAAYRADPLNRMGKVRARTGAEMVTAVAAMPDRLRRLTLPLLVLHGGADRLVPPAASELVATGTASSDVTHTVYPGLCHEAHNEPEQEQVLDDVVGWLDAHR
ncbi:alpha/beta hydrolase [Klenkia sp. PcliD-1-E]|uniref:alpha/beta hydrolase n=1 Tax=Klenkia sp. PcliD-1-E TaxID=2954492 RepID=UPI002096C033|nr:alpha/beta hydrolase [Klenkia sp. PcliD-1-E]MCO7219147.1 lysophospholipase [Klenkia sp. PcliD-1-E]